MTISRLLSEFASYRATPDYAHGVFVEMTGIAIEVLLLSITIPLIFAILRRVRTRPIRSAVDFYLFQIFHKITRMFLDMAGVKDTMPILMEEMKNNPNFEIYSHFVYGNLENILFVLKRTLSDAGSLEKQIETRSLDDFLRYQEVCERCLNELDRLVSMLVGLPQVQEQLFHMRLLVYPLRDLMGEVADDIHSAEKEPFRRRFHTYDVQKMAAQLTETIEVIFKRRRKLIDSMIKHQQWASNLSLIVSLPYILTRRWISLRICRIRKRPYRDFLYPSNTSDVFCDWRKAKGFTLAEAAQELGVSKQEYEDVELGYREPRRELWVAINPSQERATPDAQPQAETEQSPPAYPEGRADAPSGSAEA